VLHEFSYRLFMMYLDLDELPRLFTGRWLWSAKRFAPAWFRRRDHFGDERLPLDRAVRDLVENETGRRPSGPIRLLTHLRYFGYGFNPVSFYFCFEPSNTRVETIVAEVSNTPWGERHCYVLDETENEASGDKKRYRFRKAFHVSPFMDMDFDYDWRFTEPGERLAIHMDNLKAGVKHFDATMTLERKPLTGAWLARVLLAYPFMTVAVITAIYFEAVRLWIKRVPFQPHSAPRAR